MNNIFSSLRQKCEELGITASPVKGSKQVFEDEEGNEMVLELLTSILT